MIVPILWVGAVHLAAWSVGEPLYRLLTRGGRRLEGERFGGTLAMALGFAALAHAALFLAAARLLYGRALVVGVAALAGLAAVRLARAARDRRAGASAPPAAAPAPRFALRPADAPLVLALVFAATFVPSALDPSLMHDDNVYHLKLPSEYLAHHALVSFPMNLYANMPHLVEVLYTLPMAIGDYTAAKVFTLSLTFWTIGGLVAFARPLLGRWLAGVAALLYLSGKNVQWHLGLGYVEPVIGLFLLAATLAFLAWRETGNAGYLRILAIGCGVALASKYSAWFYAAPVLIVAVVAIAREPAPAGRRAAACAVTLGIAAAIVAPWLLKNALFTGNPIYPNLFRILDGRFWTEVQEAQYLRSQAAAGGTSRTLVSYLALPIDLALRDYRFFCPSFSIALMALFLVALALPSARRAPHGWLHAISAGGFLAWCLTIHQGRFLVAWVPVMALSGALALAPLRGRRRATLAATTLVLAVAAYQVRAQRDPYAPRWDLLVGPRAELETRNGNYRLCAFLNDAVAPDGKVLVFWDNRFFFLQRECWFDSVYEAPSALAWLRSFDDAEAFTREIVRRGFTHVVVNAAIAADYMEDTMGVSVVHERIYPASRHELDRQLFDRFVLQFLERLHQEGNSVVFRIRSEAVAHGG